MVGETNGGRGLKPLVYSLGRRASGGTEWVPTERVPTERVPTEWARSPCGQRGVSV